MVWTNQWTFLIDGNNLSDYTNYITYVPEVENTVDMDVISVAVDGDYPSIIRLQPREGTYTLLIQMTNCDWATYQTRLQQLKSWLAPGLHTLTVQIRGQTQQYSVTIATVNMIINPKQRSVSVKAWVPKPVLA